MIARGWYVVSAGLAGTAIAIALTGVMLRNEAVTGLQRVAMPGRAELTLAPGRTMVYVETRSQLGGKRFDADEPAFTCTLTRLDGHVVELQKPHDPVAYDTTDFAGHNVYDIDVPSGGIYTLECTAPHEFVLSIGGGITAYGVVALAGGAIPGLAAIVLAIVVFVKRRKRR